ncbi:PIN domain-containing protein [Kiritimatiella glycovorans]|uniref:PIN domain protein n=1 Tax=Kiritimatiella glycovorans TaxID=1307763 RepID=A0A0G3EJC5_9BACT|nr:PIN domain-containing protein [Kiritimatiella glycovorans]AKJ65537.1 PIN domain protein [Kiritimatiella glycovorans]
MNGKRYFLDTNAIIALLAGNNNLLEILNGADYVATFVICELEYLAFPGLPDEDKALFGQFREKVNVVDLASANRQLKEQILTLRTEKNLKLPDAVIAGSAMNQDCILLTEDKKLLSHEGIRSEIW